MRPPRRVFLYNYLLPSIMRNASVSVTSSSSASFVSKTDDSSQNAMDFWKQQDSRRSKHQQQPRVGSTTRSTSDEPKQTSMASSIGINPNTTTTTTITTDHNDTIQSQEVKKQASVMGRVENNVQGATLTHAENGQLGEMQIKLDIAAAKLLTEEMKYTDILSQLQDLQTSAQDQIHSYQQEIQELKQMIKSTKQEKDVELQELCSEIQRLHSSHQAERQVHFSETERLRTQVHDMEQRLQQRNEDDADPNIQTQDDQEEKMTQMQHENEWLRKDLKTMVEESERLELELETVTEDRDELLRRSTTSTIATRNQTHDRLNETETMMQLQEELDQLRFLLEEEKQLNLEKEDRIHELQGIVEQHKKPDNHVFDLDISAIDVVNTSFDEPVEKESEHTFEKQLKHLQDERLQQRNEMEKMKNVIDHLTQERDSLKECLADAMQELEELEHGNTSNNDKSMRDEDDPGNLSPQQDSTNQNTSEVFVNELMQIIKEKDEEITVLKKNLLDRMTQSPNVSSESFHEDVSHVIEWMINSSNRLNGSPSIEVVRKISDSNSNTITLPEEDEKLLQSLNRYLRDLHINAGTNEAHLASLKRQQQKQRETDSDQCDSQSSSYDTSTEASFEKNTDDINEVQIKMHAQNEAEQVCMRFRKRFQTLKTSCDKYEQESEVLRQNLSEAVELVKPLKEHVLRIDEEKAALEYKLSVFLEQNKGVSHPNGPLHATDGLGEHSLSNLRKKDEEIMDLKIENDQLKNELRRSESDLVNVQGGEESFSDMPTPTKHNITARKNNRKTLGSQPTNEEDGLKFRSIDPNISRLALEVEKRISAEKTLKSMLHTASLKITTLNVQVEELLKQKVDAEKEISDQKLNLANLEKTLKNALRSQESMNESSDQVSEYKELLKEMIARNDKLMIDVGGLTVDLKTTSKEKRKLKKSLEEAVGMLNSLRSHVETAEKERKKLKKQLRALLSKTYDEGMMSNVISPTSYHEPDPDEMANKSTILQLRSVVVEMEHEIRTLEERIQELENIKSQQQKESTDTGDSQHNYDKINGNQSKHLQLCQEELEELQNVHANTKKKLDELTEINREMLLDLQQTEEEASETWKELVATKHNLESAREEIENAISLSCTVIRKLDMLGLDSVEPDFDESSVDEGAVLTDYIDRIDRRLAGLYDIAKRSEE